MQLATRQLDDSLDYPVQDFRASLQATMHQLGIMASWHLRGSFDYRLLDYNPGFSLVSIDPATRKGHVIVEFHGFHNEATSSRMHIEISRRQSDYWYTYWTNQFSRIWEASMPPVDPPARDLQRRPATAVRVSVRVGARCCRGPHACQGRAGA